jgi:hypothetical protein
MNMQHPISRRDLMKRALVAGAVPTFALLGKQSAAADLTPLNPSDATAQALGFVADASKVVAASNPTFKAGQMCSNCAQFQGKPTDSTAGCTIFSGHSVPASGWCRVWSKRPG